jgi:hypothetical protein
MIKIYFEVFINVIKIMTKIIVVNILGEFYEKLKKIYPQICPYQEWLYNFYHNQ